jgi:acetyl esterase/lipase
VDLAKDAQKPAGKRTVAVYTVSYGSDPLQTIAVYPSAVPGSPLVIMVHGGGWRSSTDVNMEVSTAKRLRTGGFTVFDTNYRSDSPTMPAFPNETNDIVSATTYAIAHASSYNGDSTKVNLLGGSSGAQLVAMAAEQLNASAPGRVSTVVTMSAPFDFAMSISYWSGQKGATAKLHLSNQLDALGCSSAATCPASLENQWSADLHVVTCPAKWLILNSSNEEIPVSQADGMTSALRSAGCSVTETIVSGAKHGFHYFGNEESQISAFMRWDCEAEVDVHISQAPVGEWGAW